MSVGRQGLCLTLLQLMLSTAFLAKVIGSNNSMKV